MTDNPNMVGMLKQLREMQKDLAAAPPALFLTVSYQSAMKMDRQ